MINNQSISDMLHNITLYRLSNEFIGVDYNKHVFFAMFSALIGLPLNILLLTIVIKNNRNNNFIRISYLTNVLTGSFERFLFEILYHFLDNFLSYIHHDHSTGQHYLIHILDFCCKFLTYFAKMSVLLATWLLLFLIVNQFILVMNYHRNYSCWKRSLYYVNAKYSTIFLIFIFSIYNIYPIEVLKYQRKIDVQDYQHGKTYRWIAFNSLKNLSKEGTIGVCSITLDGTNKQLLNVTNYGYNLLGILVPCIIIFLLSIIILHCTCRNNRFNNSFQYIAAIVGLLHGLFNFPGRLSDILVMLLSPYSSFYLYLIHFNHHAQSFVSLTYAYKCFICLIIPRRYRLHARHILCFLINYKCNIRY